MKCLNTFLMKCLNTFHFFKTMIKGNLKCVLTLSGEFLRRVRQAFFKQEELSPKLILISYNHQALTVS